MICFILFIVMLGVVMSANNSVCGVKCFSFGCRHNRGGRCNKKEITIYDNTVTGLCLYHTDSMKKRVINPVSKVLNEHKHNAILVKMQDHTKDEELLKNPKAFSAWMKKRWICQKK